MYESRVLTVNRAEEHEGEPRLSLSLSLPLHSDYFRYPRGPHESRHGFIVRENILEIIAGRFDTRNQQHFIKFIQQSPNALAGNINAVASAHRRETREGKMMPSRNRKSHGIIPIIISSSSLKIKNRKVIPAIFQLHETRTVSELFKSFNAKCHASGMSRRVPCRTYILKYQCAQMRL